MSEQVSNRLVDQRVRNRVIEVLELLADGNDGLLAVGDKEYVNLVFDWVDDEIPGGWRSNSTYVPDEVERIEVVHRAMLDALDGTAGMDLDETAASGWPTRIQPLAAQALALSATHGRAFGSTLRSWCGTRLS
jgi:hypothetical protein